MRCKVSGKNIIPFMSFGKMPMANGFIEKKNFKNEFFYNLEVGFCEYNYLFQVNDHPKSQKIFNNKYPFYTSKSQFMREHFQNYFFWAQYLRRLLWYYYVHSGKLQLFYTFLNQPKLE